jgi:hypothetical protein
MASIIGTYGNIYKCIATEDKIPNDILQQIQDPIYEYP